MKRIFLWVLIIIVFVGGIYLLKDNKADKNPNPNPNITACTEEALLCPDGSSVGREGANCTFKACPNQDSIVGILKQDQNGFWMMIGSPQATGEVAYKMPIEVKVSNAIQDLVNRRVKAIGTFSEGNTLRVETLELLPGDQSDPTLGTVGVGKSVFINGVLVTLNSVSQDSRCPKDVVCIQAGSITANITLKSNTDTETLNLVSNKEHSFDSFKISITKVSPDKSSKTTINPGDYALTFKVTAL